MGQRREGATARHHLRGWEGPLLGTTRQPIPQAHLPIGFSWLQSPSLLSFHLSGTKYFWGREGPREGGRKEEIKQANNS